MKRHYDKREYTLRNYAASIPGILKFQLIVQLVLAVVTLLFRGIRTFLLASMDKSALISEDIPYLLTSVQGWILIIAGILFLAVYIIFEVHAVIILSVKVLRQEKIHFRKIARESLQSVSNSFNPFGLLILLFISFLSPLVGFGFRISYTSDLYIPDFILSVIQSNQVYKAIYYMILAVLLLVICVYIFTFHFVVLKKQNPSQAFHQAGMLMRRNYRDFIRNYIRFLFGTLVVIFVVLAGLVSIIVAFAMMIPDTDIYWYRVFIIFSTFVFLSSVEVFYLLFYPFQMMQITRLFEKYLDEEEIRKPEKRVSFSLIALIVVYVVSLGAVSCLTAPDFEDIFPPIGNTQVTAHRAGGTLAEENTISGIRAAAAIGADASEIDVQRTADGAFVIFHDTSLKRLTGVDQEVSELTLEQIKQLSIQNTDTGMSDTIAELGEMLDDAKDKIKLYIELKGSTADEQMAEDVYKMITERDMLDQVVLISLKYPLISQLETSHPEVHTGYLCYAGFGSLEELNVDELILEEETASVFMIDAVHKQGKQVSVWTVNHVFSILKFYARGADAVISDYPDTCINIRNYLKENYIQEVDDLIRVVLHTVFVWDA